MYRPVSIQDRVMTFTRVMQVNIALDVTDYQCNHDKEHTLFITL